MAGPIRIAVLANGAQARRELNQTASTAGRFGTALGKLGRVAAVGLGVGLAAGAYGLIRFTKASVESLARIERINAQTVSAIKATGGAANVNAKHVESLAGSLENLTATEAETTQENANLLLTFRNVKNELGAGNAIFDRAVSIFVDMQRALPSANMVQLGRALNDPVKGITALTRAGVSFTAQQTDQIKKLSATGRVMAAQKIILRELSDEFEGSGEAFAKTTEGKIELAKHQLGTFGETITKALLPPLADLALAATGGLRDLTRWGRLNVSPRLRELADWWSTNKDRLGEFASTIRAEAVPALGDLIGAAADLAREVAGVAGPLAEDLLPAVGQLAQLAASAASSVDRLPGPVRTFAVGVGIAAIALPRMTAGLAGTTAGLAASTSGLVAWTAAATTASTRSTALGLAALRMGGLMKTAAGPAGIGALILGAQQGDTALGRLADAAGGAAIGFSVGGPWGAVIGGIAGGVVPALHDLVSGTDDVSGSMAAAKPEARDFASTLDQVTAASTAATRALALQSLQDRGALEQGTALGLNQRTLIDALLGRKDAQGQVQAAIAQYSNAEVLATSASEAAMAAQGGFRPVYDKNSQAIQAQAAAAAGLANSFGALTPQLRQQTRETRTAAIATADLTALFPQLRKGAIAKIRTLGTEASVADVLKLQRRLKLTPKELRTLLRVSGAADSEKAAARVIARLRDLDKTKVAGPDIKGPVGKSAKAGEDAAAKGGTNIVSALRRAILKTRADMPQLPGSVRQATAAGEGPARTGGAGIGSAVKTGFGSGFAGAILSWSSAVAAAVRAAIAAGRAAARAKSPSEETADLGRDLADGLIVGLASRAQKVKDHFAAQIRDLLVGATGSEAIGSALDKLSELIKKRIDLEDPKAEAAREKAVLEHLAKRYAALRKIGKQQTALIDGNYLSFIKKGSALYEQMTLAGVKNLTEAKDALAALQQQSVDYAATVKQAFVDFANISSLGQSAGPATTTSVLTDLRKRAEQALQFASLIRQLRDAGLNATALAQLIAAGPESLGVASAIAAGGAAAVTEINQLQAQIEAAGGTLGSQMADQFYAAGIAGAAGLVAGLEAQRDELDKVARKMANALVRAVKDQLGMKSPSRVFRALGANAVQSLALGLDEVYVKRQGERVAKALVTGYGSPALRAYLSGADPVMGGRPVIAELHLSSDQVDAMQRGARIVADVSAFRDAGGRTVRRP